MIFLDTSAIYALADAGDPNHDRAVALFDAALAESQQLLLPSYVLVESAALIQRRLGLRAAIQFLRDMNGLEIHWVGPEEQAAATDLLAQHDSPGLSLVHCVSFVVMHRYGLDQALAFNRDFEREGLTLCRGPT